MLFFHPTSARPSAGLFCDPHHLLSRMLSWGFHDARWHPASRRYLNSEADFSGLPVDPAESLNHMRAFVKMCALRARVS